MDVDLDIFEKPSRRREGVIANWWSAEDDADADESANVVLLQDS